MFYYLFVFLLGVASVVIVLAIIIIIQSFLDWGEESNQNENHDSSRD